MNCSYCGKWAAAGLTVIADRSYCATDPCLTYGREWQSKFGASAGTVVTKAGLGTDPEPGAGQPGSAQGFDPLASLKHAQGDRPATPSHAIAKQAFDPRASLKRAY